MVNDMYLKEDGSSVKAALSFLSAELSQDQEKDMDQICTLGSPVYKLKPIIRKIETELSPAESQQRVISLPKHAWISSKQFKVSQPNSTNRSRTSLGFDLKIKEIKG